MKQAVNGKLPKQLANAQLAPLLQQYAGTNASWYLSPRSEPGEIVPQSIRAALVVEQDGQEVNRWEVYPRTYSSIVLRHLQTEDELYAIPHVKGYQYEDLKQTIALRDQTWRLLLDLRVLLNKMLWARYTLDDTVGIELSRAVAWWEQTEEIEAAISLDKLWHAYAYSGSPLFKSHSDYLAEQLVPVQVGYEALVVFMAKCPPPTPPAVAGIQELTDGKGQRYMKRHWYTDNERGRGYIVDSYYCPYNELEVIKKDGRTVMRAKDQVWPNAPTYEASEEEETSEFESLHPSPVREQLLHVRRLIDDLLGQLG